MIIYYLGLVKLYCKDSNIGYLDSGRYRVQTWAMVTMANSPDHTVSDSSNCVLRVTRWQLDSAAEHVPDALYCNWASRWLCYIAKGFSWWIPCLFAIKLNSHLLRCRNCSINSLRERIVQTIYSPVDLSSPSSTIPSKAYSHQTKAYDCHSLVMSTTKRCMPPSICWPSMNNESNCRLQ